MTATRREAAKLDWTTPEAAFLQFAHRPGTLFLSGGPDSQSYLFPGPGRPLSHSRSWTAIAQKARAALAEGCRIAGLFTYEAARLFEPGLAIPESAEPDLHLYAHHVWLRFDPAAQLLLAEGESGRLPPLSANWAGDTVPKRAASGYWAPDWPKARYLDACRAVLEHIRAGDIYQTNLSQSFSGRLGGGDTPEALFLRLMAQSPAPFAAFLRLSETRVVITNSPERFLRLENRRVETRPIKGTMPRGVTPEADAALAGKLGASEKDRAENLMIVDLMRHDLSRVCAAGSVSVPELFRVESYANVHHLVSTVTGQLAEGKDALDLVAAAFPPGSITGAPKIRAMEILGQQEGKTRGAYCGALGWIGEGGQAMDLNVMIRTLTLDRDESGWQVRGRSGGAITIDSDPEAEYAETLAKASALKKAIEG